MTEESYIQSLEKLNDSLTDVLLVACSLRETLIELHDYVEMNDKLGVIVENKIIISKSAAAIKLFDDWNAGRAVEFKTLVKAKITKENLP